MSRGHPTYRPLIASVMIPALLAGNTYRDACEAASLPWTTWKRWARQTRDGDATPEIAAFVASAREAHGKATVALIANVNVHGRKDWRASMSLVEFRAGAQRRAAEASRAYWEAKIARQRSKGTHVEHVEITGATDAELDARIAELERAARGE